MTARLQNKTALITGGAGGIGIGIAKCYLREGARVILSDLQESDGERAIVRDHDNASFVSLDVTDEAAWQATIGHIVDQFGQLDILVNCAGILPEMKPLDEITLPEWQRVMDINLTGNFLGMKHAIKAMKQSGGSIIDISSIAGMVASPLISSYSASKGGTRMLTKAAAIDATTKGYNIRVNSVHPGVINTPMTSGPNDQVAQVSAAIPMKRVGQPQDIGEICVYLGSDESNYVTGSEFTVDGGYTAV
ncbi:glucose 1-dehydrogenase [Levilactobacillus yiduensis]|uniref:glucose 1-dehydrogenase n=1 Tax=Levilactobacillus yiduensis TaxID=2953880 RepID=UPI000EF31B4D|nr:glucose 1-dehydrogenase [Levilactobacillus yiduensis]AYM02325.1 glucose 1-dehydrogenase [Levilactobacillus brevis]